MEFIRVDPWRSSNARRLALRAACVLITLAGRIVDSNAQLTDPLPDLPSGAIGIRLSTFAQGLPVEREFITPVFTQRVGPTDLALIPDGSGRLVVTNYGGTAYLLDGDGARHSTPFLELRNPASPTYNPAFEIGGAHGLTSLAFHPDFHQPLSGGFRRFYTLEAETLDSAPPDFVDSVIAGNHHQDVLYEYTLSSVDALTCDEVCGESKRELLRVTQPGWHHNLGDLLFNDDGQLFVSSGDGNVAGFSPPFMSDNAQLLTNIFGKVLRIDPLGTSSSNGKYGVPGDNPFADGPGGNVDEIYAYGLRNPFRLEFDTLTGQMFASETGELEVESVEAITMGANYGWNRKEGSFVYDAMSRDVAIDVDLDGDGRGDVAQAQGLTEPVFEYDHDDGRAIVGAVPYRGDAIPPLAGKIVFADFNGKLFYGDESAGQAFRLVNDAGGTNVPVNVHSVNRDANGEIYVLGIVEVEEDIWDGVIVRLHSAPALDGDFDFDGQLSAEDIDQLSAAIRQGPAEPLFDVDNDGSVDVGDRMVWVSDRKRTYFGDANLDGQFNSADLVNVLAMGKYEVTMAGTATWSEGDFDGDGSFNTADLVVALADGGYEAGPRPAARAVPEPVGAINFVVGWMLVGAMGGRRRPSLT